jgi:hypothetical protein
MRAYAAGFGTAGSLIAGAALLFVLASALVAFGGWPKVGAEPAPVSVVVSPPAVGGGTPAGRRLAVIAAGAAVAPAAAPAAAPAVAGVGAGAGVPAARPAPVSAPTGAAPRPGSAPSAPSATAPAGRCTSGCGAPAPPAPVIQKVNNGVSDTRSKLGSTIVAASNTTAGAVRPKNGGAAEAVQTAGTPAGNTVSGAGEPPEMVSGAGRGLVPH